MWLNINKLENYNFLSKIGIHRHYNYESGEWSYWNWEIWKRLKFISKIVDSSIGKQWDDVWKHILSKVPKKHHHLLIDCEWKYKPDYAFEEDGILYEQSSCGRLGKAWKNNIYINRDGILFISYSGREWKNKKYKTKVKKNVPYFDKLIYYWSLNSEYVYLPGQYEHLNSKIYISYINTFWWSYKNEEGERKNENGKFRDMIRWFEKHNKTYLIYYKDRLFYSENFNKTMLK